MTAVMLSKVTAKPKKLIVYEGAAHYFKIETLFSKNWFRYQSDGDVMDISTLNKRWRKFELPWVVISLAAIFACVMHCALSVPRGMSYRGLIMFFSTCRL